MGAVMNGQDLAGEDTISDFVECMQDETARTIDDTRDESPAAVKARVMARRKEIECKQARKYAEDMREAALIPEDSADRFIASCNPNYSSTVCAP